MRTNWVRERLRAGKPAIGCFLSLGSPNLAELMAHVGYDFLVIETEHNGLDSAEIQHMLMAMNGTEVIPIVRVPSSQPTFIQRALDMGALGVLVPLIKTADEARAVVQATRYPPVGTRGFGPLRASNYTLDYEDYYNRANDNIIVSFILETKEAVENLAEIAAVPGVDALYVGTFDLCISLGLNPMRQPHPEIEAIVDRAVAIGRETGVAIGLGTGTPDGLRQLQARGLTYLVYGTDALLVSAAAKAGIDTFDREAFAR